MKDKIGVYVQLVLQRGETHRRNRHAEIVHVKMDVGFLLPSKDQIDIGTKMTCYTRAVLQAASLAF